MYKISHLPNGPVVVSYRMSGAFSVSIGIWFRVGSRYEDDARAGISHVLEHMVFKGSKKYSADAIKRGIEGSGGHLNGFTSEELTCYLAKVPQKMARPTFEILLDMSLNPRLLAEDLNREKTVIIEEIKMYNDLPQHIVQEQLDRELWPNHPLGRSIAGTAQTVSSITPATLNQFKNDYYTPNTMVIVFTGNIHHDDCLALVGKSLKTKKASQHAFDHFVSGQNRPVIRVLEKDIEQANLAVGFAAYERMHPKRYVLTLLSVILGGNMSSRLFDTIREKRGLVYAISSHYKRLIDTGAFYILAGLDTKNIDVTLRLSCEELHRLKTQPVPLAELKRAKEFILGQLAMSLEDTLDHMVFAGESIASTDKIQDFNSIKKDIVKVTPRQIQEVARDIFRHEKLNVSLVGPIKDFKPERCEEELVSALG